MCFHVFYSFLLKHFSKKWASVFHKKIALIMVSFLLAGCSSNTMRFADGMFTGSTSGKQTQGKPVPTQSIPPSVMVQNQAPNHVIESNELAPIENTGLPEESVQVAGLGAPPRNLGTLPASEVKPPVTSKDEHQNASQRYIVQSGDTLSRIATRRGVSLAKLREANALESDTIRIGQVLTIPTSSPKPAQTSAQPPAIQANLSNATASRDSTAPKLASTPTQEASSETSVTHENTKTEQITPAKEQIAAITPAPNITAGLRWPTKGRILSSFGQREGTLTNDGIDIMIPEGTPIKAAESGVVIYAGDGLKEFGNTILIRHEDNLVTVYGHNGQLLVQRGQKVRRGDEIAKSGKSGNTTTPKLHFEVRKNSTPVNPIKYLES